VEHGILLLAHPLPQGDLVLEQVIEVLLVVMEIPLQQPQHKGSRVVEVMMVMLAQEVVALVLLEVIAHQRVVHQLEEEQGEMVYQLELMHRL
tara:strand:- start:140 stop:415 length:276 start_codon:yes stop_codon:yes gene_type:complete